jgi:serine/threonine protein kinase/WD40 repeat protein
MKCPKCHSENPDTKRFCGECGTQLLSAEDIEASPTKTLETPKEELTTGSTFARRYQIIEELGKGGMGNVYKVLDKEINAKVALKLINPEISADKKTIDRFRNELKLTRDITHKNVCRMYDLNKEEQAYYITMEYVSGEDLKSFIRRAGPLGMGKTIFIAKQVCEGLAEAHRLGVVHRDLKPQNIMIDREGNARIMDFGIARSLRAKGITGTGIMIGTPEYMSPEQAEAKEIDNRSDIYSLGVILYEMVTGRVPFEGDTPLSIAMKHKSEVPPNPKEINSQIPDNICRLILKCLEKDKEKRYQSAGEVRSELISIEEGIPTTEKIIPKRKPITSKEITITFGIKRLFIPGLVFLALLAIIVGGFFLLRKHPSQAPILPSHEQLTFTGNAYSPAIAPDGNFIAYVNLEPSGEEKVMVHDVGSGQAIEVFRGKDCRRLRWLPDGSELSFVAERGPAHHEIIIVPRLGGTPRQLEVEVTYDWSPDSTQIANTFANRKRILLTNKATGESASIPLKGSFTWLLDIDWSPLGNLILFETADEEQRYAIWTVTVDGSQQNKVIEETTPIFSPRWSPRGDAIYYLRSQGQLKELWKIPVTPDTGKPSKPASQVLSGIQAGAEYNITSDGKSMLCTRELFFSNLWLAQVEGSGKDRAVRTKKLTTGTILHGDPNISPDGKLIAFFRGDVLKSNIYIMPAEGGSPQQITFLNSYNRGPVWSPDGKEIAFGSNEGGVPRVWKVSVHGGKPHQFSESMLSNSYSLIWSPGAHILYQKPGNRNFHILDPETGKEVPLVKDDSVGWLFNPQYSPDGKRVAVFWNRPPTRGIWVISLDDFSQEFMNEGEESPIGWSPDGKWIYAYDPDSTKYIKIEQLSKQVKTLPTMSFMIEGTSRIMVLDERPFVFLDYKTHSDVWVVENFDPEME